MENTFSKLISPIEAKLTQFHEKNHAFLKIKIDQLRTLQDIVSELNQSASGSWIGFHSKLYFQNFEKIPSWQHAFDSEWGSNNPIPSYWQEKSYDEIIHYVKKSANGLDFKKISNEISPKLTEIKQIQKEILTDLVILRNDPKFSSEIELLDKISSHKWGASTHDLIGVLMPKTATTRDAFAIQQGIQVPPHVIFGSEILSELSKIQAIEDFIEISQMLIRQINVKIKYSCEISQENSITIINNLISRFHQVCRQLRVRHDKRPTLDIEDEYDVQDLLRSLLKLFFDDIRTEEWTPQYAGGASRMDFLLKEKKIVIEVKKTRISLSEKQIGDQLILDVVKYKQHQDCKILFCFIYDPEGRIGNPTGLEKDLNQMTTDDLQVIVKIAPL